MDKTEPELRNLFEQFNENGMEDAIGVSVDDRIRDLNEEIDELKAEREEKIKKTGSMKMPGAEESRKNITKSMAERFQEDVEYGSVSFYDFIEYLYICERIDICSSVLKDYL